MTPVFLHINSSAGRYIRRKFCEKYDNAFYVHHINPLMHYYYYHQGLSKNRIVRFWRYRDPATRFRLDTVKMVDNTISVLDLEVDNKIYFTTIRNPIDRYLAEINRSFSVDDMATYSGIMRDDYGTNLATKSLLVALYGDINYYFKEITEEIFEDLINILNCVHVIILDKDTPSECILNDLFEFNVPVDLTNYKQYTIPYHIEEIIIHRNKWDIALYNHFKFS